MRLADVRKMVANCLQQAQLQSGRLADDRIRGTRARSAGRGATGAPTGPAFGGDSADRRLPPAAHIRDCLQTSGCPSAAAPPRSEALTVGVIAESPTRPQGHA